MVALAVSSSMTPFAYADGGNRIRIEDRCNAATFNAQGLGNICQGDGNVTFAEFAAALTPAVGGNHHWRFHDSKLGIKAGQAVNVDNTGGETHSFTEVSTFGKTNFPGLPGFVLDLLNGALPADTPFATPPSPDPSTWNFIPSGGKLSVTGLSTGIHRFQCMIHPWMRATVTVKG